MGSLLVPRGRWRRRPDGPDGRGRPVTDAAPVPKIKGSLQPARAQPGPGRRWSPWWALWLALGYLGQVALRLYLSRDADRSAGQPRRGRVHGGRPGAGRRGAPSDFSFGTLYQGGYPLLLVPIYWFTSNSVTVYHATLAVNAVVNAALMPLAYLAFRRLHARALGGVRRRGGRGRRARRRLLHPVRDRRRDLPGRGPGLAALRAQLADRADLAFVRRGGGRRGAAGLATPTPCTRAAWWSSPGSR